MKNPFPTPFKRLILRAVLHDVSPIVARVFSIPDDTEITDLHDVFLSMLGWQHDLGFIIRVHGQEFNSNYPPAKPEALACEPLKAVYS